LGLGFLVVDVMIGIDFVLVYDIIGDPTSRFCGSKLYWILA